MTEIRFNNCFILHVHKELAECINLEDVAKELNDHAANSGHFPPIKMVRETRVILFSGGGGGRVAMYGMNMITFFFFFFFFCCC